MDALMHHWKKNRVQLIWLFSAALLCCAPGYGQEAHLMGSGAPPPVLVVSEGAPSCVRIAVEDLAVDFEEATGRKPEIVSTFPKRNPAIVIRVAEPGMEDFSALDGKWETFVIRPVSNQAILVAGSDARGTMYGVYELSERLLGTDPLKHWTERIPERMDKVFWKDGVVREGPPSFKYRGLFINDEDFLMGWKGDEINPDLGPEAYAEILETIGRLKGNLIAPAMYATRMDAESRQLCNDRGIYYTASHLELLLANPQRYWKPYALEKWGEELDYSFSEHPEKLRAFWRDSIREHEGFKNIWPVGLRGITDFAFWVSDKSAPTTREGRAQVVDGAIQSQFGLLDETLGSDEAALTSLTLYEELAGLFNTGLINVRDDTLLVWCDAGYTATMLELPDEQAQKNPGGNGVYFHLANCDKQWSQWVSLEHLQREFKAIVDHRATQYALFNVGDIREVLLSMDAAMDLVWNAEPWVVDEDRPEQYLDDWMHDQFGVEDARAIGDLYRKYFELENPESCTYVIEWLAPSASSRDLYPLWYATSAMRFVEEADHRPELLQAYARLRQFPVMWQRRAKITEAHLLETAGAWDALYQEAIHIMPQVKEDRRAFFFDNFVLHIQTSRMINHWALSTLQAFKSCETGDFEKAASAFKQAGDFMDVVVAEREKASHGKWENWFRGEYHNGWDLNLWTLHPQWHAEDARYLADLALEAATSDATPPLLIEGVAEGETGTFPLQLTLPLSYDAESVGKIMLHGWSEGKKVLKEMRLLLNGTEIQFQAMDGSKNPFYGVEVDASLLKPGENTLAIVPGSDSGKNSMKNVRLRWILSVFGQ